MDKTVLVALLALCGTVVTVAGGVIVAIVTSNKESKSSAESALEKALRERLTLKDEQLQDLQNDLDRERAANVRKDEAYRILAEEHARCKIQQQQEGRRPPNDPTG